DVLVLTSIGSGQSHHNNSDKRSNEARDNLIHTRAAHELTVPAQRDPDHHRCSTYDQTSQRACTVSTRPGQGQNDQRTEGSTKARPGVTDQPQNLGIRIRGDEGCHQANGYNTSSANIHTLFIRCFLAQEQAVEIFGQRGGGNQQLTGDGTHDCRQQRSVQEAGNQRVEQQIGQNDENGFRIGNVQAITYSVGAAKDTQRDCANQGDTHPGHTD